MKKNRLWIFVLVSALIFAFAVTGCKNKHDNKNPSEPQFVKKPQSGEAAIFDEELGWYNSDASVMNVSVSERYVYYTSNEVKFEKSNVIAVRKGTVADGKVTYGEKKTVLTPSDSGWDQFNIGGADVVKGNFNYGGTAYTYLMAYHGCKTSAAVNFSIGFAVSNSPDSGWIRVGTEPVVKYNPDIYGKYAGFYAPSIINNNQAGNIKMFYTWADAYGHFAYFSDIDCADLSAIPAFGYAMLPTKGLSTGEAVVNFPNGDFAYDSVNNRYYVVKDYSPSAGAAPAVAEKIELAWIAADELYAAEPGAGWQSLKLYDDTDTVPVDSALDGWERIYSPCIASDISGRLTAGAIEIIYTASSLEGANKDYLYTPSLHKFIFTA